MRQLYLVLFFFFLVQGAFAQWITIKDAKTEKPIAAVVITNKNQTKQLSTGNDGRVSLTIFAPQTLLYIKAPSYLTTQLTKKQLLNKERILYLDPDDNQLSEVVISVSKWGIKKKFLKKRSA